MFKGFFRIGHLLCANDLNFMFLIQDRKTFNQNIYTKIENTFISMIEEEENHKDTQPRITS